MRLTLLAIRYVPRVYARKGYGNKRVLREVTNGLLRQREQTIDGVRN